MLINVSFVTMIMIMVTVMITCPGTLEPSLGILKRTYKVKSL